LHNLKHRPGVPPQLFVTPGTFRMDAGGSDSSFIEYLLYQFINVLLAGGEQRGVRPLVYVGEHLTRAALVEAVEVGVGAKTRRWPLGGRAFDSAELARRLRSEPRPCRTILQEAGADPKQLAELCIDRLGVAECRDLKGEYRKRLVAGFIRATLVGDGADLADFLTDGFADVRFVAKPTRTQLTLSLLQALSELIVGAGIPVAAAFDQLEELAYGQTEAEMRRASDAFFGGLVQLMSQAPGIAVLLFAEEGLWNRIVPPLPSHILDRIHEPIHLPTFGTVRTVRLSTPTTAQLTEVVACRIRRTLSGFPNLDALPPEFPFEPGFLADLAKRETVLRLMLQACCNRLDEMSAAAPKSATTASASTSAPPKDEHDPEALWADLRERWSQEFRAAERKLKPVGALAAATADVQAGLARWLGVCKTLGVEQDDWRLAEIADHVPVGDHPTYGSYTLMTWRTTAGAERTLALGLWLGRGVGKPRDLETKLAAFRAANPPGHLALLRPSDDARLSGRTQALWDEAVQAGRSLRIEAVELDVFAKLYAFPRWMQQLQDAYGTGGVPEHAYVFLAEQTEDVMLRLGLPAERATAAA
jgi:hypothetical protein